MVAPGEIAEVAKRRLPIGVRRHYLKLRVCAADREEDFIERPI